ncbi:receptor-like protein 14 [Capsicum annuum]|uniref:receptor-like protein 14 n=1 Tax=Capsicum annuum TaxID=4072 RepID=UPI001FB13D62|nr:receptor-like protein 14 [Capsicum annuum]
MSSLVSLDLSFNCFEGTISSSIFSNLTLLETLRLSHNRYYGLLLFASFVNLSSLEVIDLTNNKFEVDTETPSWVSYFQLVFLDLRNIRLNQNYGHVIPLFIAKQHNLKSLSLSYNSLQGNVPAWLYNNTLFMLSLRNNRLYGGIPVASQFQASTLLMLNVSDNCLGSILPINVHESFPKLLYLNLSHNALGGTLASSFDNLLKITLHWHKELCGPPLKNEYAFLSPPQQHDKEEEEDGKQGGVLVTPKTLADVKGCTLISYDGKVQEGLDRDEESVA